MDKKLIDAPLIAQVPELARGCEVTSLAMMLQFTGIQVDKMTLANEIKKVPFEEKGLRGHPNEGFIGDIYTFEKPGLGVYHRPIADLARNYLGDRIIDLTGKEWHAVLDQIDKGHPVWVVVTSTYQVVPERYWETWQTEHGEIRMTYKEHSVLVTGYDDKTIYFNDPQDNVKNCPIKKKDFLAGWRQFGNQAISYN